MTRTTPRRIQRDTPTPGWLAYGDWKHYEPGSDPGVATWFNPGTGDTVSHMGMVWWLHRGGGPDREGPFSSATAAMDAAGRNPSNPT
jgi:hypothetical protein